MTIEVQNIEALQSPVTPDLEAQATEIAARLKDARTNIRKVIFGQDAAIDACLTAILSGGHFLLMGLPGLGKTKLVETLSTVLGLDSRRVQCTPDLMPADILGSEILQDKDGTRSFNFIKGPIFTQLLMADEINRASPRTQSALLQAMQEYQVSVGGTTYALPRPFHVMATQNPLEQEGTYPLPEAQLDRFMLQVNIGYPSLEEERRMVLATTGSSEERAVGVFDAETILQAQQLVRRLPIGQSIVDGILNLVQSGRPHQSKIASVQKFVHWGPGPRAAQAFMLAARAKALLEGRLSPSLDDVTALAPSILQHRMALHFSARAEGQTMEKIIAEMCAAI